MTVTSIDTDLERGVLELTADFDASVEAVWQLWADPRKLEQWWGPPGYPATFVEHELTAGGRATYYMTGPDGGKYHGYWRLTSVNEPKTIEFTDGFANDDGTPNNDMPITTARIEFTEHDGGTRMLIRSTADTPEQMAQLAKMGMEEGLAAAVGQMDALLHR
jgi:uncharacterized protein YndB with AHSA1/START domain